LVGAEVIDEVWKERRAAKARGNGAPPAKTGAEAVAAS
jgi:hypothetical protein